MGDDLDSFEFQGLPTPGTGIGIGTVTELSQDDEDGNLFDQDELGEEEMMLQDEEGYSEVFLRDGDCDPETERLLFSDFGLSSSENEETSSEYSSSDALPWRESPSLITSPGYRQLSKEMRRSIDQSILLLQEISPPPPHPPPPPHLLPPPLDPSDHTTLFMTESQNRRYVIQPFMKRYLHIFPWFSRNPKRRYRELLNRPDHQIVVQNIILSLQFWYSPQRSFTSHEIERIKYYYETNPFPSDEFMLTHIITVTADIQRLLFSVPPSSPTSQTTYDRDESSSSPGTIDPFMGPDLTSSLDPASREAHLDIIERLDLHDGQLHTIEGGVTGLKIRRGGDRAGWFRIRSEDFPTRSQWCVEGGVFGLYADGVGPLVACDVRRKKFVIVYSTDPDTVEDLPDPENPDLYVRYVMVVTHLLPILMSLLGWRSPR